MTRALIVDDKPDNLYLLRALLTGQGWEVEEARHGAEALVVARRSPPDLVISDLLMPVMDGYTLLRRFKADERLRAIPFVVYTATYTEREDERLARDLGADAFLLKPAEPDRFLAELERILAEADRGSLEASSPATPEEPEVLRQYSETLVRKLEDKRFELEQLNQVLAESERRLATLLSNLPGMAYRCANDPQWTMEYVSEGCLALTGHPAERLLGNAQVSYADLIHSEDREGVWREVQRAVEARDHFRLQYRLIAANGEEKWVWEQGQGVFGADGALQCLEGFITDVTDRMRAAEALRESEERFRRLAENAQDLIYRYELLPQRRFSFVSPSATAITGYTPEEHYADPDLGAGLVHPDDREVLERIGVEGAVSGEPITLRWIRRDGRIVWTEQRNVAVRDAEGRLVAIEGIARDVTAQRELEEQLRQSQKLEAVGRLAGGVAHDFNNLLAVMMMQAEMLQGSVRDPETMRGGLAEIRAAAERGAALTRQLLLFGRRQALQPRDLDLNEAVTGLASMLRRLLGEDVELQLHLHPAPLPLHADAGMLDQVLMNLAINARDAMPGGGRLRIETAEVDVSEPHAGGNPERAPGRYFRLRVSDTGAGIPPEALPHLFEPFFTTKEPGKGTGLGLATVFGIVRQHGGWIEVESASGQGARFDVHLPAADPKPTPAGPVTEEAPPAGGGETLLLVEDEPELRRITRAALERAGYRVIEAADGQEALGLWERERDAIDLLLTDLVLPGPLGGRALAARLRARSPGLKVLLTSGYSAELADSEHTLAPWEAFLQKPAASRDLLAAVRNALDGGR